MSVDGKPLVTSRERALTAAKLRFFGEFSTPLGMKWRQRVEASEAYYRRNSADWDYLRNLQFDMQTISLHTWATTVATGYATINATAIDTYFSNPEAWIQVKGPGDPHGDIAKALRDVTNTIHRDGDTSPSFRKCLLSEGFAGYGGIWTYFEQDEERQEDGKYKPVAQRVCNEYVEPWHLRFDPDGRDWKLKIPEHKYIIRKYFKTLQQLLDAPFVTDKGKAMLKSWGANRRNDQRFQADVSWRDLNLPEMDPGFMVIPMYEIWDAIDFQIIHMPVGSAFDVGTTPWPRAFKRGKKFPLTFVAFNWEAPDRYQTRGFYPIPTLRLIAPQIENINRLEGLYMEAATSNVIKFLVLEGLLNDDELEKINNDRNRLVVTLDITKIREMFPGTVNDLGQLDLRKLFTQIPTGEKTPLLFEYEKAINFEFQQISRVIGQGAQDRYGMPQGKSATETAGLMDAMNRRGKVKSELAADIYDQVTEKIWLVLKTMQTLPVDYRTSSAVPDLPGAWKQMTEGMLGEVKRMDLAYYHRVGSNAPRDTQTESAVRTAAAQQLLPIFLKSGDMGKVNSITKWMLEPLNFRDLDIFDDQSKQFAIHYAMLMAMLRLNPLLAHDPDFVDDQNNTAAQLVTALLTPAEMQDVAKMVEQKVASGEIGGGSGGQGRGEARGPQGGVASLPSPSSPGEAAYGAAAAGGSATAGSAAAGRSNIRPV